MVPHPQTGSAGRNMKKVYKKWLETLIVTCNLLKIIVKHVGQF
jgi:hypothetical protein